jgi:hypothetical protein
MLFKTLGIMLGISLTSAVAHAEEPTSVAAAPTVGATSVAPAPQPAALPGREEPQLVHVERWYGAPALGVDAAAIGLGALSLRENSPALAYSSLAAFALSAPINHALHGKWGRAGGSLLMRVTMPVLAGYTAALIPGACDRDCLGFYVGILAGMGAASAIDATAMSWEEVPEKQHAITPVVAAGKGMAYVGASGVF